jgi:tripartite-type tricarboxylate transporter receptor subunit TctC
MSESMQLPWRTGSRVEPLRRPLHVNAGRARALAAAVMAMTTMTMLPAVAAVPAERKYPDRPIRYIVPFAPGGPTDILSRAFAEPLSNALGTPVVVDNRGGAGGVVGTEIVARAAPDGYTMMIGHVGTHAINPSLYGKVNYDPERDFQPISLVATWPLALSVHPSVPAKNVKELIALARAKPGSLNFASAGTGGPTHLAAEMFKSAAGIDIVHVPYKGNAAALTDLVTGQVQMMFSNLLTSGPFIKAGKLRALAVSTAVRSASSPDVPTLAEAGVAGYNMTPWYGVLAPAGLPRPLLTRLNSALVRIVDTPELRDRFASQGVDLVSSTPEAFAALIRSEVPRWRVIIKQTGARAD